MDYFDTRSVIQSNVCRSTHTNTVSFEILLTWIFYQILYSHPTLPNTHAWVEDKKREMLTEILALCQFSFVHLVSANLLSI